jgi:sarcosine oxidase subunit gamma
MPDLKKVATGHINVRGNAGDKRFTDGVMSVLGQPLPTEPNTFSEGDSRLYWLGPDEWQVVIGPENVQSRVKSLAAALAGQHVAINDLSGGQVCLHLSGTNATLALTRGCTLDLHPTVLPVGHCAQSGLAKANVLIACIDAAPVYEIIVRRSFAEYLLHWLRQTANIRAVSASSWSTNLR